MRKISGRWWRPPLRLAPSRGGKGVPDPETGLHISTVLTMVFIFIWSHCQRLEYQIFFFCLFLVIVDNWMPSENHRETGTHARLQPACLPACRSVGLSVCNGLLLIMPMLLFFFFYNLCSLWELIKRLHGLLSYCWLLFIYSHFDELWFIIVLNQDSVFNQFLTRFTVVITNN